ncbi:MAG TPA: molybdopterin-dependent oxidoreductase [bacterium]|nr:molybdopterin-dependent oxidoreductase [bacterium]HPQ65467.1 molybdopterin-dependent oxidoreductase [bacterium]
MKRKIFSEVSKGVRKVDAVALATGQPVYTDDFDIPGMLHGKILRSPLAHARIKSIRTTKARRMPGVEAVITWRDVPRIAVTTAGQGYPEPSPYDKFIFDNKVRFVGDEVALVVADTEEAAERALGAIEVEYEELEPLLDVRKALKKGAPVVHDEKDCRVIIPIPYEPRRNLVARVDAAIGNVDKAYKASEIRIDREYENHISAHSAIEPHCSLAYLDPNGRLTIVSSTQVPYHVRRIVARAMDIPVKRVRVIKPRLGGGFGSKQDIVLEPYVAAATLKTGKPVKIRMTREEVFVSSRTRHGMVTNIKIGAGRDGTINAIDLHALSNTGAYGNHGLTVACNVGMRTLVMFACSNMRFTSDVAYTNLPNAGAYRGYGGTQGILPTACAIDELAVKLGMDPVDVLLKNIIAPGAEVPILNELGEGATTGAPRIGSFELAACLRVGSREFGWKRKLARKKDSGRYRRGVGMSPMIQGSSIPYIDMASAFIKMNDDGSFNLNLGATDIGQGSDTVLAQIAAETLTVATDDIIVYASDTDLTPFDVGAYASSTTYLSGRAVKKTAEKVKELILKVGAEMLETSPDRVRLEKAKVIGSDGASVTLKQVGTYSLYEKHQFQIAACESSTSEESPPPTAAHFVEIEVDTLTGRIKVLSYLQAVECGTPINPALCHGQVMGAVVNGLSYALVERFIFNSRGKLLNPNYDYFKIFCSRDRLPIKTIFVPSYEETGPYGAKSVGEVCINGPMPAISNAIYNALGIRMFSAPFTPEKVLDAIAKQGMK